MKKILTFFALVIVMTIATTKPVEAKVAGTSATFATTVAATQKVDNRAEILKKFLESYDSPLAPYADVFVAEADKNDLDWKLVPAIAGVESWFGQQIPFNSYNGWGYGVYGTNVRCFTSWEDGIATVSNALREDYLNSWGATNVNEIGAIYAADPRWSVKVQHFIDLLEDFEKQEENKKLSLSL